MASDHTQKFSMVQECVSTYVVNDNADGSLEILIEVPRRFANLWKIKLSELQTTTSEVLQYDETESEHQGSK